MIRDYVRNLRKVLVVIGAGLMAVTGAARAQDASDLKARLEAQERELQALKAMVLNGGLQPAAAPAAAPAGDPAALKTTVEGILAERDQKKKADEEAAKKKLEDEGYVVGSDLKLNARWNVTAGVMSGFQVESPNKDFTLHIGGRFQEDTVFFTESPGLKPPAQFGDLQDGTYFRRLRLEMDGKFWEVWEYKMEFAFEQVRQGVPTLDEMFVGLTQIPFIGTIRAGHMRVPQGLEGDLMSSSKSMTFLEKSLYTDAFYQNFAPGIWTGNSVLDQHLTWEAMMYRQEFANNDNSGADFGDGEFAYTGRMTFLPLYEDDGVQLLHLGVSGTWRKAEKPDPELAAPGVVRFRARPSIRDATGDFGTTTVSAVLPGLGARLVDTGVLPASSTGVLGTELFYVCGPFSLQSEWAVAYANDVTAGTTRGNRSFNGGYIQASYFLTGEHRSYDRRLGRLGSNYFDGPNTNFWLTRGEDGSWLWGRGAWEIAARYDYLNLNDGPVVGGVVNGVELGLNWYMNPNVKVQFEYFQNNRWDMKAGLLSGDVQGFGTRVQLYF